DCDNLTWFGERGGDHAVGIGLEIGVGELVARKIKRAPRALKATLCFIARCLLAVKVGDRGPAVGLELRIALEVGSRLRDIRGRRGELRLGALQLQPEILGIKPRHDVAHCDAVADIDAARDDLAGDAEAEIGLVARAPASRSPWSCRYWATSTGWQKFTSEIIISPEVSRGSMASNSPRSMPSRKIDSKIIRMCSLCARMAPQLNSIAARTMSLTR